MYVFFTTYCSISTNSFTTNSFSTEYWWLLGSSGKFDIRGEDVISPSKALIKILGFNQLHLKSNNQMWDSTSYSWSNNRIHSRFPTKPTHRCIWYNLLESPKRFGRNIRLNAPGSQERCYISIENLKTLD
jgi:hypothetical protein